MSLTQFFPAILFFAAAIAQADDFKLFAPSAYRPNNLLEQAESVEGGLYALQLHINTDNLTTERAVIYIHLPPGVSILESNAGFTATTRPDTYQFETDVAASASVTIESAIIFEEPVNPRNFSWALVAQEKDSALIHRGNDADFISQALKDFTQLSIAATQAPETPVQIISNKSAITSTLRDWASIRNDNLTRQQYDFSCGAASTATILRYFYNIDVSEQSVLQGILTTKGTLEKDVAKLETSDYFLSFEDIKNYTQTIGFKAIGLGVSLETLRKLQTPAIVHVRIRDNEHFSVYRGMDNQFVYLADPSFGNIKVRISKFEEMFFNRIDLKYPGRILVFVPQEAARKAAINTEFMNLDDANGLTYQSIMHHTLQSTTQ